MQKWKFKDNNNKKKDTTQPQHFLRKISGNIIMQVNIILSTAVNRMEKKICFKDMIVNSWKNTTTYGYNNPHFNILLKCKISDDRVVQVNMILSIAVNKMEKRIWCYEMIVNSY